MSHSLPAPAAAPAPLAVVQAVRALAALAVLVFHTAHAADKHAGPMPLVSWTELGLVGVDVFFVLSGFIIAYVTAGREIGWRDFAWARLRRIFLPYWPLGLGMLALLGVRLQEIGIGTLIASVTLLPLGKPALNVAWTLQHEVVFYAAFALGLASGWWRTGLALWLGAIAVLAAAGTPAPIGLQPIDAEFIMGLAAWATWRDGRRQVMLLASAGLALAGLLLLAGGDAAGIERGWPMGCAALFAAGLPWLLRAEAAGVIRTPHGLRFLGDASYAIYLAHGVPLVLLAPLWADLGWPVGFPLITLTCLAAGIGYHLLVERPLLARVPKRLGTAAP